MATLKVGTADVAKVYVGSTPARKVYQGSTKVWELFSPSVLAGLAVWLDALAPGDLSVRWDDRSGNGNHGTIVGITTPHPEWAPVVRTNALNGLPVVRFAINEGRVRGSIPGVDKDYTLAYVGRSYDLGRPGRIVTTQYPPDNALWGFWNNFEDVFYANGFYVRPGTGEDPRVAMTTSWRMYSGDGVTGECRAFNNGVLLSVGSNANGWGGHYHISGYDPVETQETCDCEIAELVIYNRRLSDAERQQVETYLRTKWGL